MAQFLLSAAHICAQSEPHFHPLTGRIRINGIFDYGDAAWADRHHDFRYFLFGAVQDTLLEATMRLHGCDRLRTQPPAHPALQRRLRHRPPRRSRRLRDPTPSRSSGRTLAQDLVWTR
jgi:hypothetical protein